MSSAARIRVKFLSRIKLPDANLGRDYLRRFPGRSPSFGRCDFVFDPAARDYDWLVVYDDLPRAAPREPLACAQQNTLLLTGEPSSITVYGRAFLRQFGHVLTSQEPWALKHPRTIRRQAGLFWYYGGTRERGSFDALAAATPPAKTKLLSTVCSTKAMKHTLHSLRLEFTRRLKADLPSLDVFGYGMGELKDKADALDPYKYHIAIENHSCDHHWTEKLADAFLGHCLPLYFGCTNLDAYFPRESYVWIDIRDYAKARAEIERVLRSPDEYERRLPAIIEARRRVIHEYATFPQLARLIEERHNPDAPRARAGKLLRGRRSLRLRHPLDAMLDVFDKGLQKTRHLWSPR
jgi:Glycosyltransferase family 10 (fucosyltransferase).